MSILYDYIFMCALLFLKYLTICSFVPFCLVCHSCQYLFQEEPVDKSKHWGDLEEEEEEEDEEEEEEDEEEQIEEEELLKGIQSVDSLSRLELILINCCEILLI